LTFSPKKYYCTICNKGFRRQKQHYNHVNRAHRNLGTNKQIVQPVELKTIESSRYYGSAYNYSGLATGMRHLRAGLPLPRMNPNMRCAI
jgi:hypothetical protein